MHTGSNDIIMSQTFSVILQSGIQLQQKVIPVCYESLVNSLTPGRCNRKYKDYVYGRCEYKSTWKNNNI